MQMVYRPSVRLLDRTLRLLVTASLLLSYVTASLVVAPGQPAYAAATPPAAAGIARPAEATPGITVTPQRAPSGTLPEFTITGGGYTPGEGVTITGGPFSNFQVTADGTGAFETKRQSDSESRLGAYRITATGATSGASHFFDVFLTRFDLYNNTASGNMAVAQGTSANLRFDAWGFGRSEAVVITSDPPGLFADVNVTADSNGSFCCQTVNTNTAATAASYTITATGATTGFSQTRRFNVLSAALSQQQLQAGQHPTITITASGLTPNAPVTIAGGPFGSSTVTADPSGAISVQEPVVSSNAGRYVVTVTDSVSGGRIGLPLYLTANWFYRNPTWTDSDQYHFVAGFQPGEVVRLSASPAGLFAPFDVTANSNGAVDWARKDLSGVAAGTYTVTATGQTSGYTSSAVLSVSGYGIGVSPQQVASPGVGQFTLSATGFSPNEYVDITDSGRYCCANPIKNFTIQADSNGAFSTVVQSTGGYGRHDLRARGRSSGVENNVSLYITGLDLAWGSFVAENTAKSQYLQGYGFLGGEPVQLTSSPAGLFASQPVTVNADSNGNIFPTLSIQAVAAGDYQIIATGQNSGYTGSALYHVGRFALSPNAMVSGQVSEITFSGAGYTPNETVDIWNDNHGDFFADFQVTADADGAFSVTRTLSGSGGDGYWTWARAQGRSSGIRQDRELHKLSLRGTSSSSVAGAAASFTLYIRGFARSGTVQLRGGGLFADQSVNLDGNGNANVNVTVDTAAPAATYTLTAEDSSNSYAASTTYVLEPAPAGNPVLHLDTTPRLFNANAGATQTLTANISLNNNGGAAVLNWTAAPSTTDGAAWLGLNRTSGSTCVNCGDSFQVQVNPTGLASGIYRGTVTVSGQAGTVNSPQSIAVTLGIQGGTTLTLTPNHAAAGTYPNVTLTAVGFDASEDVDITGGPWANLVAATDASGNLSTTVQITSPNAGQYTVTLQGRASGLRATALLSLTGVTVSPTGARTGQTTALRVSGAGYAAGQTVAISATPAGLFAGGTATADANGAFNFAASVPDTAPSGQYQITGSGAGGYSAQATFNLSTMSLTPVQTGQPGVTLQVSAAGYRPSEQVRFWLTLPYCCLTPVDTTLVADGNGVISASVTVPPNAQNGMYLATARGNVSGVENTARFFQTGMAFNTKLVRANTAATVTLAGYGFLPGEAINLASTPAGLFTAPAVAANVNGDFSINVSINAPAGFYRVVATGAASSYSAAAEINVGSLSVTPAWQQAGSLGDLTIVSSGFAADETVHLGYNSSYGGPPAPFENFDRVADGDGNLSVTRRPSNGDARRYNIQVWNDRGAVNSVPYYQVSSWLNNVSGTLGQANTFQLNIRGYHENETVQVSASDPALFAPVSFYADGAGNLSNFNITTRASAPAGGYVITVRGVSSGISTSLNYHIGTFTVAPQQAVSGERPALQLQGSGFAPNERVRLYGGRGAGNENLPFNEFFVKADGAGAVATAQNVYTSTPGRYNIRAAGDSGAVGSAVFYLTGVWLSASQVTAGYDGNLFIYGAGFGENEAVNLSVSPAGLFASSLPATTGLDGSVGVAARISPAAAAGPYTITLTGARTGYTASAAFAVGSFTATPDQATKGTAVAIQLTGAGYQPGSTINFWDGPWPNSTATADGNGAFSATLNVDPARNAGKYNLRAYSYQGNIDKYTPFYLTGLTVAPVSGLSGTGNNLTITGAGYKEGDTVTVSASPSGLFAPRSVLVNSNGAWSLDLNTDAGAPEGSYTITAAGTGSFTASAPFSLNAGSATPFVAAAPDNLTLTTTSTSGPTVQQVTLTNSSAADVTFTAAAATNDGGSWLTVSPTSGTVAAGATQVLDVTFKPFRLAPSTYGGAITVSPSGATTGNPKVIAAQMVVNQGAAGLTVSPRQVLRGTTPQLTFTGSGFQANEPVALSGGPFTGLTVNADASGSFTATQQVAPGYDSGAWNVRAHGNTSGIDYYAPLNITWLQYENSSYAGIRAGSGSPLRFSVRGWQPGEAVTVTVSPAGLVEETVGVTDGSGNIWNWSLATSTTAPTGVYTVQVTGQTSGMTMSVPFLVLQLAIDPVTIQAGQHPLATLTGSGFTPNGDVTVSGGPWGDFVTKADGSGNLNVQEPVHSGNAGAYTVRATDRASSAYVTAPLNLVGIWLYTGNRWPGEENYLFAAGFLPNERLDVQVSPAGAVADFAVNANSSGAVDWARFVVSGTAGNGPYTFTATGAASGRQAQAVMTVNGGTGFGIAPDHAVPGSYPVLTLTARGFQPNELVDFDSGPYTSFTLQADNSGNVTTLVQVTTGEARRWSPRARGRSSGITSYASYTQPGAWTDQWRGVPAGYTGGARLLANGFQPNETVTFSASPAGLFAPYSQATNSDGYVDTTVQLTNAPAGVYSIGVIGQSSGYSSSFLFFVQELTVSPAQFRAGETPEITVTQRGFQPGETVRLYDEGCGNCLFNDGFAAVADSNGVYTATFRPTGATARIHRLRARGDASQNNAYANLYVSQVSGPEQLTTGQAAIPTIALRGFRPRVNISLTSNPSGLFATANSATDDTGALDFAAAISTAALAGRYQVIATDIASGFTATTSILLVTAGSPVLKMDASPRAFVATEGSTSVQTQSYYLNNSGGGALNWTAAFATASGGAWLSGDAGGSYGAECCYYPSIRVNPTGLAAGTYTGTVTVSAPGAENAPQTIDVRLTVTAAGSVTAAISPQYGPVNRNTRLAITGSGFAPNEPVDVSSSVFERSRTTADASGLVSLERFVAYAEEWRAGRQTVTLTGVTSGLTATAYFGLQRFDLSRASAPAGQAVSVNADIWGMAPGETVTLSSAPAGLFPAAVSGAADGNGYIRLTFTTPAGASPQTFTVHATGAASGSDLTRQFSLSQLTVTPLQWRYGQQPQLFIEGNGYAPNEWVDIRPRRINNLDCCGGAFFSDFPVQTDAAGHFGVTVQVAPNAWSGAYELQAQGRSSGMDARTRIYQTDFEFRDSTGNSTLTLVPAGGTIGKSTTPNGRTFAGEFGNQTVSLGLDSLPAHSDVTVSFDLYILKSWDGNNGSYGPDTIDVSVAGGPTLLHSTFSNTGERQAYPDSYPGGDHPAREGATESNTLGSYSYGSTVYHLTYTVPHTDSSIVFNFAGLYLQGVGDESWGLDNVNVTVTPDGGGSQASVYSNDFESAANPGSEWTTRPTVLLRGWGFQAGETITLSGDTAILSGQTTATASSAGDWQFAVPFNIAAAPGVYGIRATGNTSGFTTKEQELHVGTISVTPRQWLQYESPLLTIAAEGFSSGERVSISSGPFEDFSVEADAAGRVSTQRRVTLTDRRQQWNLRLLGTVSGVEQRFMLYQNGIYLNRTSATATVATSVQVCGYGFLSSETVQLISSPAGLFAAAQYNADGSGNGCITPSTLTTAAAGQYDITLTGQTSGYQVSAAFRVVNPGAPFLTLNTGSMYFSAVQDGGAPADQTLVIGNSSEGTTLNWTATVTTSSGGNWLSLSSASGAATTSSSSSVAVTAHPAGLAEGTYTGQIVIDGGSGTTNSPRTVNVRLDVGSPAAQLTLSPGVLGFAAYVGGTPAARSLRVSNTGGNAMTWTAAAATQNGGDWLALSVASGSLDPGAHQDVSVSVTTAGLAAGTYTGTVTVSGDAATRNSPQTVNVTLTISERPTQAEFTSVAPADFTFNGQEGVSSNPSSSFTITNGGGSALSWSSSIVTSNGVPWLSLNPASGNVGANGGTQTVGIAAATAGLFQGTYTATVTLTGTDALQSPQTVTVTLNMAAPAPPGLQVSTSALSFQAVQGGANPVDQQIQITNNGGGTLAWTASASTTDGGNWLSLNPASGSATSGNSTTASVHITVGSLAAGSYTGTVTISGAEGTTTSPQTVNVTLQVNTPPPVPLSVQISTDQPVYAPGDTMQVRGTVTQGATPITDATVQARFVAPDGAQQVVALSNGGSGNVYSGGIAAGSVAGNAALYLTATAPGGLTAQAATGITISGHTLGFSGAQSFPGTLRQSDNGTVVVRVQNEAYVNEATVLELRDVTGGGDVLLVRSPVSVPARNVGTFYLTFPANGLAIGPHTLRAVIAQLPAGQDPAAVTQIEGNVTIAAPQPQMSVNPLQPTVSVQAGASAGVNMTVANNGPGSSLEGIQMSLVSRSGGTPYPWVSLSATSMAALGYQGSSAFTVTVAPPANAIPNAYQDTAVRIATSNGGTLELPLTVYVDSNRHASVVFAVSDDTGQPGPAVPGAQVELVSTVPPFARQTATANENGVATFNNISVGVPYSYNVTAANHSNMTGTYTAQDETTQTVAVVLPVRAIQTTWTVTPTTITDVYDINLQLRYEVDVPLPRLAVAPTQFAYTKDPADPAGPMLLNNSSVTSGDMTIYNPSRITVSNIVVDASAVQGVNVTLSYSGQSGSSVTIPSIPPLSNVKVRYETSAFCPVTTLSSQITLTGEYTYSPVVPTLSMSENAWTVALPAGGAVAKDLVLSNTGYNVATGITVSNTTNAWITTPHNVVDLGLGNTAPFKVVVAPPAGAPAGTYTEDLVISAGNGTPDNHLQLTVTLNADGSGTVQGSYTSGTPAPATGTVTAAVPVRVYRCEEPAPAIIVGTVSVGGGGGITVTYGGAGGSGGGGVILPPSIIPPPPPQPTAHEIVELQIPQRASLERQAFIADLKTTNTAGATLEDFQVTIKVTDPQGSETNAQGQRYVDLFAITVPVDTGYGTNHSILNGTTAESEWTLVPAPGLGGTDPAGARYNVSAVYTYLLGGQRQSVSTQQVEITIYPMPQLVLDYYVPRDVQANHPVKLGVVVRNIGAGPANNLKIVSGQPQITSNVGGVLVTFGLLGGSVKGNSVPTSNLTLDFGNVPGNSQTWGYWVLSADLDGQFTAFTATYTQRDYRGATLSPLIIAVHTNIIVQGDVVPSGGQSMQVVSPAMGVDPNALLDLETGISTPMETRYITDAQLATAGDPVTRYATASNGGWVLAVVPDPLPSTPITSVRANYPDGSNAQLWNGSGMVWRGSDPQGNKVYIVDTPRGGAGSISNYAISYGASQTAPVLQSVVGGAHTATLTWAHPDGGTAGLANYLVFRHPSGTPKNTAVLAATLGPTETTYTDQGLDPGYYNYFVRASYSNGSTADSLEKQVRVQEGAVVTFEQTGLPAGMTGFVVVDGQRHNLPYSVALGTDRPHTYSFPETLQDPSDPTGIRYVFTAPPAPSGSLDTTTTYTLRATYATQYYLRVQTNPASLKPALTGLTAAQWVAAGASVSLAADASSPAGQPGVRYGFTGWAAPVSGNAVTVNGPTTVTANYGYEYAYQFTTSGIAAGTPATVTVDGTEMALPASFWFARDTTHSFSFPAQVNGLPGSNTVYVLTNTAPVSPQTATQPATVTGRYAARHATSLALTLSKNPAAYANTITLSATLLDLAQSNAPVAGQPVSFTVGSQRLVGTTDAQGIATASYTITETAGDVAVTASFGGTLLLGASADNETLTITGKAAALRYTGPAVVTTAAPGLALSATVTEPYDGHYGNQLGTVTVEFALYANPLDALNPAATPTASVQASVTGGPNGTVQANLPLPAAGNYGLAVRQVDTAGYYTLAPIYPVWLSVIAPQGSATSGNGTITQAASAAPASIRLTNGTDVAIASMSSASVRVSAGLSGSNGQPYGGLRHEFTINGGAYRVQFTSLSAAGLGIGCAGGGACADPQTSLSGNARLTIFDAGGNVVGGGTGFGYRLDVVAGGSGGTSTYALTITNAQGQLYYQVGTAGAPVALATGFFTTLP